MAAQHEAPRPPAGLGSLRPGAGLSAEALRHAIESLIEASTLSHDERVELLGGIFVSEAVRPYWRSGCSAGDAHRQLSIDDPELADAVEALAPMLLGRVESREDATRAVDAAKRLLGL